MECFPGVQNIDEIFATIEKNNIKLKSFCLSNYEVQIDLGIGHISKWDSLEELEMDTNLHESDSNRCLVNITKNCPNLKQLDIGNWHRISKDSLLILLLLKNLSSLTLSIDLLPVFCDDVILHLPNLQDLTIEGIRRPASMVSS